GTGRASSANLCQGKQQTFWIAREQRRVGVGQKFAAAGDGCPNYGGKQGRDEEDVNIDWQHRNRQDDAIAGADRIPLGSGGAPLLLLLLAEQVGQTQEESDRGDDGVEAGIAIANMGYLVRQDAFQLAMI